MPVRGATILLGIGALAILIIGEPGPAIGLPISALLVAAWPGWGPDDLRWPRGGRLFVGLAGSGLLAVITARQVVALSHLFSVDSAIFRVYYEAGQAGLSRGWEYIYDNTSYSFLPYLNPPPLAWVVSVLGILPFGPAHVIWTAIQGVALVATILLMAPGPALRRTIYLLLGVSLFADVSVGGFGEPVVLIGLGLVLSWRLLGSGRQVLAGLALAVIAIKPQIALLVPFALICAGYWRTFLTWAIITLICTALSVWQLGAHGLAQYLVWLSITQATESQRLFALEGVFGLGWPVVALQVGLAFVALLAAYRARREAHIVPFVSGILGSALIATVFHWYDLYVVVLAGGLLWTSWQSRTVAATLIAALVLATPDLFGEHVQLHAGLWFALELVWLFLLLVRLQSWRGRPAGSSVEATERSFVHAH